MPGVTLTLIRQEDVNSWPHTPHYFVSDGHGSTRLLLDTNAAIVGTFLYDAYGNMVSSNATVSTEYLYCGEQFDSELGMYYLRARYYRPETGRFWTMDTFAGQLDEPLSLHKYLFCRADPVLRFDPSGHEDLIELESSIEIGDEIEAEEAKAIGKRAVESVAKREWMLWDVTTTYFRHEYIWAQNVKTGRAYGYHVFADLREMVDSRNLAIPIPGLFAILPQPQYDRLAWFVIPGASRVPVMFLSKKQFVVWNALAVGLAGFDIFEDAALGPFPYETDINSCNTWKKKAATTARFVGLVPF
jgi:RHS repeat-associated protein